jgi:hypothetical protein
MSTFKDILYKKNDDETWTEWNNRLDNDQDKLDYIGETIYIKIYENDKENASHITDRLLGYGVADLIPLLENTELLHAKIEEAYRDFKVKWEAEKPPRCYEKDEDEEEVYKQPVKPVKTLTVAEMITALSFLPPDAKLVMTESGFYSDTEFAEVMLPEAYIVGTRKTDYKPDLPDGTQVYRIGHSKQWY